MATAKHHGSRGYRAVEQTVTSVAVTAKSTGSMHTSTSSIKQTSSAAATMAKATIMHQQTNVEQAARVEGHGGGGRHRTVGPVVASAVAQAAAKSMGSMHEYECKMKQQADEQPSAICTR